MPTKPAPTKTQSFSTGPRTDSGKATSSQNSLRHGLASGTLFISGEDPTEWECLLTGLLEEWQPATPTENLLVHNMAKHHWLVERALRLQSRALETADPGTLPPSFALLRYQITNERAFTRAQNSLEDMQRTRREFVSQKEGAAENAHVPAPPPPPEYHKFVEQRTAAGHSGSAIPVSQPKHTPDTPAASAA